MPLPDAGGTSASGEDAVGIRNPLDPLRTEADTMSEPPSLPSDSLAGSALAGYWLYGYDIPDHLGGRFVTGQLLLRADGVLLRRQTLFSRNEGWQRYSPPEPGKLHGACAPRIPTHPDAFH
jgi:hypothetical protein